MRRQMFARAASQTVPRVPIPQVAVFAQTTISLLVVSASVTDQSTQKAGARLAHLMNTTRQESVKHARETVLPAQHQDPALHAVLHSHCLQESALAKVERHWWTVSALLQSAAPLASTIKITLVLPAQPFALPVSVKIVVCNARIMALRLLILQMQCPVITAIPPS
jgi:hypothetical protein